MIIEFLKVVCEYLGYKKTHLLFALRHTVKTHLAKFY